MPATCDATFDVLIFPSGAIPAAARRRGGRGGGERPASRRARRSTAIRLGRVTGDRTVPADSVLRSGTAAPSSRIGDSAANLAAYLQLPIENHLVENGAPLPRAKFFVPGSVLSARVDTTQPLAGACGRGRTSSSTTARCSAGPRARPPQAYGASPRSTDRRRSAAAGRGVRNTSMAASSRSRRGSAGPGRALRPRDPAARPAARHVQAAVQRDLLSRRRSWLPPDVETECAAPIIETNSSSPSAPQGRPPSTSTPVERPSSR